MIKPQFNHKEKAMSSLTLYSNSMSRGNTVDLLFKLLDVPYQRIELDYGEEMHTKEYLAINPMGKVPTLVDGDKIITETAAICVYLADKFIDKGLAPALGTPERADYYRWFFFTAGPIEAAFTAHAMGVELDAEQQKMSGFGSLERAMDCLETGIANAAPYICGKQLTAVDAYVGYFLLYLEKINFLNPTTVMNNYLQTLKSHKEFIIKA